MTTSLGTFQTRLQSAIGGRGDTDADLWVTQGVNFGCTIVSLLFEPPELQQSAAVSVGASVSSVSLSSLTRLKVIKSIYNSTSAKPIWAIPIQRFNFVVPSESGHIRFYSRDGSTLYVSPAPAASNTLEVKYDQFPLVVSAIGDTISFDGYDSMVESYAMSYIHGCMEELEQGEFWRKLGDMLLLPEQTLFQARQYLEGGPLRGNYTK